MADFAPWDFDAPLDVEKIVERVPPSIKLRGIFARGILEAARQSNRPLPVGRFFDDPQRDVPMRDMLTLIPLAAQALHPDVPPREGIRRLGRLGHDALLASPVGRVLFAHPKPSVRQFLRSVPSGIAASGNHARASIVVDDDRAVLTLDPYYAFIESAIGSLEAAIERFNLRPDVRVRVRDVHAFDVLIRWSPR